MCVVVRMARIAGKENLFEVATCRLLNFGSPDFSNATTFPPQEKDDCNRKAEGSYQAARTGIESSPPFNHKGPSIRRIFDLTEPSTLLPSLEKFSSTCAHLNTHLSLHIIDESNPLTPI